MQFDCGITVKALKVGYKQMVQNYRWQCICHCFDIWEKDWLKYNKKKKKPLNKEKKRSLEQWGKAPAATWESNTQQHCAVHSSGSGGQRPRTASRLKDLIERQERSVSVGMAPESLWDCQNWDRKGCLFFLPAPRVRALPVVQALLLCLFLLRLLTFPKPFDLPASSSGLNIVIWLRVCLPHKFCTFLCSSALVL